MRKTEDDVQKQYIFGEMMELAKEMDELAYKEEERTKAEDQRLDRLLDTWLRMIQLLEDSGLEDEFCDLWMRRREKKYKEELK